MDKDTSILTLPTGERLSVPYHHANGLPVIFESQERAHQLLLLEWDHLNSSAIHLNVADERNQNLSTAQQEYLLKHRQCCHANGQWIQELMRPRKFDDGAAISLLPPVLATRHAKTKSCKLCKCAGCLLGKMGRKTIDSTLKINLKERG